LRALTLVWLELSMLVAILARTGLRSTYVTAADQGRGQSTTIAFLLFDKTRRRSGDRFEFNALFG
jgi:hypothetical protein